MKIYISGITGTGMGPLALMAVGAGYTVYGSDLHQGAIYDELVNAGVRVKIGEQDGTYLQECLDEGVDWFVYTSALAADHPELAIVQAAGVKCTKRDDFTAHLVEELGLKMVAVAGTHGKTTTTAMIVWACQRLGLPVAYIVGTTLGFAKSGAYHVGDEFFVYEADEYDRNFLKYHPWLAVLPSVSYDHPDIYPTREDYRAAFLQFEAQSRKVIRGGDAIENMPMEGEITLAGEIRRHDAVLAATAVLLMAAERGLMALRKEIVGIMNKFPGVGRRFERLADGIYTDYAHHPEEIAATVQVALEQARSDGRKGVVVVYQPHQNTRQHEVRDGYVEAFDGVSRLYWLPTYLTRENPTLTVLTPKELSGGLIGVKEVVCSDGTSDALYDELMELRDAGYLVLLMTAGPADEWLRGKIAKTRPR